MHDMRELLVGNDPEFFLVDGNGKFIPAFDTVGGTKAVPRVLPSGNTVQEDGCAVEIGCIPAASKKEYIANIKTAMAEVTELLKPLGLSVSTASEATFDDKLMNDARAWEIGCDPDVNAYTRRKNTHEEYKNTTRFAGGHVHIGHPYLLDPRNALRMVHSLDFMLAYPLAIRDPYKTRNTLYGGIGKFRYKPYGIEYRSPSNLWLFDEGLQGRVYDTVYSCLEGLINGYKRYADYATQYETYLRDAVREGRHDRHMAVFYEREALSV